MGASASPQIYYNNSCGCSGEHPYNRLVIRLLKSLNKQFSNLTLSKPDCISFNFYIYTGVSLWSLIYYEL